MHEAVEDGVGERRVADDVVPFLDGELAGDDGRNDHPVRHNVRFCLNSSAASRSPVSRTARYSFMAPEEAPATRRYRRYRVFPHDSCRYPTQPHVLLPFPPKPTSREWTPAPAPEHAPAPAAKHPAAAPKPKPAAAPAPEHAPAPKPKPAPELRPVRGGNRRASDVHRPEPAPKTGPRAEAGPRATPRRYGRAASRRPGPGPRAEAGPQAAGTESNPRRKPPRQRRSIDPYDDQDQTAAVKPHGEQTPFGRD